MMIDDRILSLQMVLPSSSSLIYGTGDMESFASCLLHVRVDLEQE